MHPHQKAHSGPMNGLLLGWQEHPGSRSLTPVWDTDREGHLITIAPTGAGKGISCAIPALLTWRGPAIVLDPRGENYAVTAARRRAMGHIVYRLDPFHVADTGRSDSLNPLDLIDPFAEDLADNAAVVAQLCMQGGSLGRSDPFWDERATAFIVKIITSLYEHLQRQPTLADVQALLKQDTQRATPPLSLFAGLPDNSERLKRLTLSAILNSSEFASDRTLASILATANSHLGFLRSRTVHRTLADSTVILDDITAGAMQTVYIIIPPEKLVTHAKLLRLWVGVMLAAITRRKRAPDLPTLFLIDETAQLGEMNELRVALTLLRAYGLRVWTFFQDIAQLQNTYSDWESIINNCKVQQYFGAKSPHARKGLKTFLGEDIPNGTLADDSQILFDGTSTRAIKRANYLNDPILRGLSSPHPFHPTKPEMLLQ